MRGLNTGGWERFTCAGLFCLLDGYSLTFGRRAVCAQPGRAVVCSSKSLKIFERESDPPPAAMPPPLRLSGSAPPPHPWWRKAVARAVLFLHRFSGGGVPENIRDGGGVIVFFMPHAAQRLRRGGLTARHPVGCLIVALTNDCAGAGRVSRRRATAAEQT